MFSRAWPGRLVGAFCLTALAMAGESLPRFPKLVITDFPKEVQKQVQQAYAAAREHPSDAEASGKLAMLLDLYHRPEEAALCYDRAMQLAPREFKWPYYEGSLRTRQKQRAQAVALFRQALHLNPRYLPARLKFAESLLEDAKLEESRAVYAAILKEDPDTAEAYYGLGRIANLQGESAKALQSFQRAVELFPTYGAAHYALAQTERKLGNSAPAEAQLKLYQANRNIVPPIEDPLRDAMRNLDMAAASHLAWGIDLEQVGRTEDAIAETEKAAALDPTLVQAQLNLVILYGREGDFTKAEEHYQKAVALNPHQFPDIYYDYGVLLMNAKRFPEAERAFRQAIEIKPAYADAHNNLGFLLEQDGKLDEAAAEYRKAVEAKPDFRQAHYNLGRILINQQNFQEGIEQLRQTLTPVDFATPTYLYALGAAYGRAGNKQEAMEYLNQARAQADSFGQKQLLAAIDGDIRKLSADTRQ
jgi:tetratricopeptide (TPR) repeat protein